MHKILIVAAVLCVSCVAQAADITGDWKFDSKAGQTPIVVDCRLVHTGTALSGSCAPRSDGSTPVALAGTVNGSKANWGYGVEFRGKPGTVAFEARIVSATSMTGTLKLNGTPSPFKASKLGLEERVQRLQDESEIRAMLQDYMGLLTARDWDTYITLFSKQSDLDMPEGVVHGRDAIRTRMANATERMAKAAAAAGRPVRPRADLLTNINVRVTGDIGSASSRFTFIAENDAHQFMVTGSGLYIDALAREEGRWRIKRRTVKWDLLAGQSAGAAPATTAPAAK